MRPALLYTDTQSVVGFSVIPKWMTLYDPDWLFRVKLFSRRFGWLRPCNFRKIIAWKLIKIDTYCSAQIFGSFWQYKVCADIRWDSLERRRLEHLFLAFEIKNCIINVLSKVRFTENIEIQPEPRFRGYSNSMNTLNIYWRRPCNVAFSSGVSEI